MTPHKPNELVEIYVEDGRIKVSRDPAHVSRSFPNSVIWRCLCGNAEITFEQRLPAHGREHEAKAPSVSQRHEKTPFVSERFHVPQGGFVGSGRVVAGEVGDRYKYSIRVHIPGDRRSPDPLDPVVIVDNG